MEEDGSIKRRKSNPPKPSRHPKATFSDSEMGLIPRWSGMSHLNEESNLNTQILTLVPEPTSVASSSTSL